MADHLANRRVCGLTACSPASRARATPPDHTTAAAGTARTSRGQDRTAVRELVTAADRSFSETSGRSGPVVRAAEASRRPGPVAVLGMSAVRAVMLIMPLP